MADMDRAGMRAKFEEIMPLDKATGDLFETEVRAFDSEADMARISLIFSSGDGLLIDRKAKEIVVRRAYGDDNEPEEVTHLRDGLIQSVIDEVQSYEDIPPEKIREERWEAPQVAFDGSRPVPHGTRVEAYGAHAPAEEDEAENKRKAAVVRNQRDLAARAAFWREQMDREVYPTKDGKGIAIYGPMHVWRIEDLGPSVAVFGMPGGDAIDAILEKAMQEWDGKVAISGTSRFVKMVQKQAAERGIEVVAVNGSAPEAHSPSRKELAEINRAKQRIEKPDANAPAPTPEAGAEPYRPTEAKTADERKREEALRQDEARDADLSHKPDDPSVLPFPPRPTPTN